MPFNNLHVKLDEKTEHTWPMDSWYQKTVMHEFNGNRAYIAIHFQVSVAILNGMDSLGTLQEASQRRKIIFLQWV